MMIVISDVIISVYSAIYNISGEIWRNRLNISEKLNRSPAKYQQPTIYSSVLPKRDYTDIKLPVS